MFRDRFPVSESSSSEDIPGTFEFDPLVPIFKISGPTRGLQGNVVENMIDRAIQMDKLERVRQQEEIDRVEQIDFQRRERLLNEEGIVEEAGRRDAVLTFPGGTAFRVFTPELELIDFNTLVGVQEELTQRRINTRMQVLRRDTVPGSVEEREQSTLFNVTMGLERAVNNVIENLELNDIENIGLFTSSVDRARTSGFSDDDLVPFADEPGFVLQQRQQRQRSRTN